MSAWDLIKSGDYDSAVALLTEEASCAPSTLVFNNRGMARLHLQQYDAALADFRAADQASIAAAGGARDGDMCGVAHWMAGREEEAVAVWSEGVMASLAGTVTFTDAAGGVTIGNLLMFGGVVRRDSVAIALASKLLKKRLRAKQAALWPGPASRYLLGELAGDALLAAVSQTPVLRERQLCQAHFYIAVSALSDGDTAGFQAESERALAFGCLAKLGAEYFLSLHEAQKKRA
jgi:hypothetical protein